MRKSRSPFGRKQNNNIMKQIIEISESGLYAVVGEKIYRLVELSVTIDARPTDPLANLAPEKPTRKKYGSGKVKKQKKAGHGTTHCKICDGYGHFAKTCPTVVNPEREAFKERIITKSHKGDRCSVCGESGHRRTTCPMEKKLNLTPEQVAYIKELSEQGKTVSEIAMETGLDEGVVKKYW
jgi:hypothetical protein